MNALKNDETLIDVVYGQPVFIPFMIRNPMDCPQEFEIIIDDSFNCPEEISLVRNEEEWRFLSKKFGFIYPKHFYFEGEQKKLFLDPFQ